MHAAYVLEWEESERGWGTRPDGLSLHLDEAHATGFLRQFYATRQADAVPDEYDRPVSEKGVFAEVPESVYADLVARGGSLRTYDYKVVTSRTGLRRLVNKNGGFDGETFMQKVASKAAKLSEFDAYVERWHTGEGAGAPLHAFLGLTDREYAEVLQSPGALTRIALERALATLAPRGFTHVKSEGEYLCLGEGKQEHDLSRAVVYLGVDGQLWIRKAAQFRDGRFAENPNLPPTRLRFGE